MHTLQPNDPALNPLPPQPTPVIKPLRPGPLVTKQPVRQLLFFSLGLLIALLALELFVRLNSSLFEAASHRALAKVAMLEKHPQAKLLFLGTSRTQDGVSPVLVTRALKSAAPELGEVQGFNAAFTGSSLDSLVALAPRFDCRGLRVVIIEVSTPQIFNEPAQWEESNSPEATIEDKLAGLTRHVQFIRYRKAFLSDNLGRLPSLLIFAPSLSGWETKGKDQIASWLGRQEQSAVGFEPTAWKPELILSSVTPQTLNATNENIATQLVTVAQLFQQRGLKVVFTVPPMTRALKAPEKNSLKPLFSEVARRAGCELWNFASLDLPDAFFRDPSHLGTTGRAHYSQALAIQTARLLTAK